MSFDQRESLSNRMNIPIAVGSAATVWLLWKLRKSGSPEDQDRNEDAEPYVTGPTRVSEDTLDIHFLSELRALAEVEDFLKEREEVYKSSKFNPEKRYVRIITGQGKHSRNGPVLKPAVEKYLWQKSFKFELINPGAIQVDLDRRSGCCIS